jgi:hypothetical protein
MSKPLIIQSDKTLLLEVDNPEFEECRAIISRFAELEKSPMQTERNIIKKIFFFTRIV